MNLSYGNITAAVIGSIFLLVVATYLYYHRDLELGRDTPLLPKYAASRSKRYTWLSIFIGVICAFYFLALSVLISEGRLQQFAESLSTETEIKVLELVVTMLPGVSPAIVILLIASLPGKINPVLWWRNLCHKQSQIPNAAKHLYEKLCDEAVSLEEQHKDRAIKYETDTLKNTPWEAAPSLEPSFFDQRPENLEARWARICHLMATISELKRVDNRYGRNLFEPNLKYNEVTKHFKGVAVSIAARTQAMRDQKPFEFDRGEVDRLLRDCARLLVCLLFLTELNDDAVYAKLRDIGLPLRKRPSARMDIEAFVAASLAFIFLTFLASLLVGFAIDISADEQKRPYDQARDVTVSALLIIFLPSNVVVFGKWLFSEAWPVHTPYRETPRFRPAILSFLAGLVIGIMAFSLLKYTNWVELDHGALSEYLVFSLLSGLSGAITAVALDREPRHVNINRMVKRAILFSLIGATIFFVLGGMCYAYFIQFREPSTQGWELLRVSIISGSVGFAVCFVASCGSEWLTRLEKHESLIAIGVFDHFLSALSADQLREIGRSRAEELIAARTGSAPDALIVDMKHRNILDEEGRLTEQGLRYITGFRS